MRYKFRCDCSLASGDCKVWWDCVEEHSTMANLILRPSTLWPCLPYHGSQLCVSCIPLCICKTLSMVLCLCRLSPTRPTNTHWSVHATERARRCLNDWGDVAAVVRKSANREGGPFLDCNWKDWCKDDWSSLYYATYAAAMSGAKLRIVMEACMIDSMISHVMRNIKSNCSDISARQGRTEQSRAEQGNNPPRHLNGHQVKNSQDIMWMSTSILGQQKASCSLVAHHGNYLK